MKAEAKSLTVKSLWIGSKLSEVELLTLESFYRNGITFELFTYDNIANVPLHVKVSDANEIIAREKVFKYPEKGLINWGKGSYGGFSDIFRYKLLLDKGGWWVDMDVTCLKKFDFTEPYFFRNHWKFPVVGNVMKVPSGSELMKVCFDRATKEVTAYNLNWHKPIEILNEEITRLQLSKYRKTGLFNLDLDFEIKHYLHEDLPVPYDWYGIHWINSSGKLSYKRNSTMWRLLKNFNII